MLSDRKKTFILALVALLATLSAVVGDETSGESQAHSQSQTSCQVLEPSVELTELSNDDRELRDNVQMHIKTDYAHIDGIEDANQFFYRLRLLFRRHLINTAYARHEVRELHEFLAKESTVALVRFDNRPFVTPITDERLESLQAYTEESELARKIYSKTIKKMIDIRNAEKAAQKARGSDGAGVARDPPSFWANVWCKISNNCN